MEKQTIINQEFNPYNVPTLDIVQAILNSNNEVNYTILNTEHVYHEDKELAELYRAESQLEADKANKEKREPKPIPPKFLVAFKPDRLFLHEIIVAISTKLKLDNEDSMQKTVNDIYESMKSIRNKYGVEIDNKRKEIKKKVEDIYVSIKNDQIINMEDETSKKVLLRYYDFMQSMPNIKGIGELVDGFTIQDVIIERITDELYTKEAQEIICKQVRYFIKDLVEEENKYAFIKLPDSDKRFLFMVAGGQASGKGSSVGKLKKVAEDNKILWDDVVKINTDSYKGLLLEANDVNKYYYSQLSQEEASLIHIKICERLETMIKNKKEPHIFVDQVFIGADKLKLVTVSNNCAIVKVVSTDVGVAIERSFSRGEKQKRYEHTEGILKCHKFMTEQMPKTLSEFVENNITVDLMDNNKEGQEPVEIMSIDLKEKIIIVKDIEKINAFLKKLHINHLAKSHDQVYKAGETSLNEYLKPLTDKGFEINDVNNYLSLTDDKIYSSAQTLNRK